MSENIPVLALSPGVEETVKKSIALLNNCQTAFHFVATRPTDRLDPPKDKGSYPWAKLGAYLEKEKNGQKSKFLLGVLDSPIENNWFSRTVYGKNVSFITTNGWEYLSELPVFSFVAYEIVENLVEAHVIHSEAEGQRLYDEAFHTTETRGCLADVCLIKTHISYKIRTADICGDCLGFLKKQLPNSVLEAVIAMLEEVRKTALGRTSKAPSTAPLSLPEIVDREYPFPIAYCLRSMRSELSYSRKWLKMLELHHVTIRYLSLVLLASTKEPRAALPGRTRGDLKKLGRPTDGCWNNLCFGLLAALKHSGQSTFIDNLLRRTNLSALKSTQLESRGFIALRNDTKGHGFVDEEGTYRGLYEEKLPAIDALLEFVKPLAEYYLIKPTGGLERRRSKTRFEARRMMGSHPLFPVEHHETEDTVDTDCLLYDPQRKSYLSLYPWLLFEECPKCHHEMVFFYDRMEGGSVVLREYPTNHLQRRADLAPDVRAAIPR